MASSSTQDDVRPDLFDDEEVDEASSLLDPEDEEDWDDVEPDAEEQHLLCLFEDATFPDVQSFLDHCKKTHDVDLARSCAEMDLDIYGKIKLVNYIRSRVRENSPPSAIPRKDAFQDEKYLQPVLQDDALLYNVDEIIEDEYQVPSMAASAGDSDLRVLQAKVAELQEAMQRVSSQYADYRSAVKGVMNARLEAQAAELPLASSDNAGRDGDSGIDTAYFDSYSYHEIHETMLKDTVRTDAYRDFIYENKHLFRGKVVLDVGCGTGILSMFCAKAGAKKVIAVDNSDILNTARANVFENGLGDIIMCLRGKIEEVILPVEKVDIIVSEWMGYCLLYEAMLDSIVWARDRYLASDGLMIPSHVTLHVAGFSDSALVESHVSFWHSVYGFSMSSMLADIYEDILIRQVSPDKIASTSATFLQLSLYNVTKEDLNFIKYFEVTLKEEIDALDGWVIWFDIYFAPSREISFPGQASSSNSKSTDRHEPSPQEREAEDQNNDHDDQIGVAVSFTTGPFGPVTHWEQAVLLIDHGEARPCRLNAGRKITGTIDYHKSKKYPRDLDIGMIWRVQDVDVPGSDDVGVVDEGQGGPATGSGSKHEDSAARNGTAGHSVAEDDAGGEGEGEQKARSLEKTTEKGTDEEQEMIQLWLMR